MLNEATNLHACWIMRIGQYLQIKENRMPKWARNASNVGEVWNLVCCHGKETVKLVLWSTFQ